jgi:ribonuclease Z
MPSRWTSDLRRPNSTPIELAASASSARARPSNDASSPHRRCRRERCSRKTSFASRASCSITATPCLAFAFQETPRINVWKEGLDRLRLPVGPWLNEAKRAVRHGAPDDSAIHIRNDLSVPLGVLKQHALRTARGHRIAYVVDAAFHDSNVARIIELARGADQLFIETAFLDEDAELAAKRRHLTAAQAGMLARSAGVSRVVPFHFSPRYDGREEELRREPEAAWRG